MLGKLITIYIPKKGRKIGNWWEDMSEDYIDRGSIKQKVRKEIEKEIG